MATSSLDFYAAAAHNKYTVGTNPYYTQENTQMVNLIKKIHNAFYDAVCKSKAHRAALMVKTRYYWV